MFLEFFDFFLNSIKEIFNVMKEFILFEGFSFYNLCIALMAIPIIIKLFHFIMCIEDEEIYYMQTNNYSKRYDEYIGKHERRRL